MITIWIKIKIRFKSFISILIYPSSTEKHSGDKKTLCVNSKGWMLTLRHDSAWWLSGSLPSTCSNLPMHFCRHLSKVMQSILGPTHRQKTTLKKLKLWRSIKLTNNHIELVYYIFSKVKYFKKKPENIHFLTLSFYGDFNWLKIIYHLG